MVEVEKEEFGRCLFDGLPCMYSKTCKIPCSYVLNDDDRERI